MLASLFTGDKLSTTKLDYGTMDPQPKINDRGLFNSSTVSQKDSLIAP